MHDIDTRIGMKSGKFSSALLLPLGAYRWRGREAAEVC